MSELKYTIGADPEFFAAYADKENNLYVLPPVILRRHGAEFEESGRHPVFFQHPNRSFVHEDGAAFEMSVPPSTNWKVLFDVINETRQDFASKILSQYPGLCFPELFAHPTMNWDVERWKDEEDDFRLATLFGCDPDEDLFDMKAKCKVIDASQHPERYAGGHIHFSGLKEIADTPLVAIRSLVLTVGMAATAFSDVPELEKRRLFLYGRPGKFRIQTYSDGTHGVEYRTPSTRWTSSLKLAEKIFHWARIGMESLLVGGLVTEIAEKCEEDAKKAILSCDQKLAGEILDFIATKV